MGRLDAAATTSAPAGEARRAALLARARRFESVAALGACVVAAVAISWRLLHPNVYSDDAFVHQYWMWHWKDPQLFNDSLTADLRGSERYPDGYQALFWLASHVADPIAFGEWVGVALMALSAWLIFLIVREHTDWRPAAWIAAGLFLALIDIHRFHGGFPRAFVHPVVLLCVLLAMRRHHLGAALVAAGGALFYPPASLLALGVLIVSAVRWTDRRPRLDVRRSAFALLAVGLAIIAVIGPQVAAGGAPRVMTAAEARQFPEFNGHGPLHFFVPTTLGYLRQNRSGFDLRESGSILALAALALLLIRRANFRLLRPEVLALPVVSLAAYALAQAVLFKLYLPHRYTYPLVAFFAIVVGVTIRPTWTALWERPRPRLRAFALLAGPLAIAGIAVYLFPLGPLERLYLAGTTVAVIAGAVGLAAAAALFLRRRAAALGAVLTGLALLGVLLVVPDRWARGAPCPTGASVRYLGTLPKDAVIAGDPIDMKCLPATARRPVVISTQLAPSYEAEYFRKGRAREFAALRAYYGPSPDAIAELNARYGATHLWVRRAAVRNELTEKGTRWRPGQLPYGRYVRQLVRGGEPAVLHLAAACRLWKNGSDEVYDIRCIADRLKGSEDRSPAARAAQ
jgi:hypothetical protein